MCLLFVHYLLRYLFIDLISHIVWKSVPFILKILEATKFQVNEAPNFCLQRGLFHSDRFIIIPEQKTFEPQYRPLTGTIMQMKLLLLEVQYFFSYSCFDSIDPGEL